MRLALPGSALVHAGAVSLLFVGFVWPQAEDAAAPAPVTVNIVPTTNVTSNASEVVEADNAVSAVSSGSVEALEPISETIEPETAEQIEPVEPDVAEPPPDEVAQAEPVEASEIEPVETSEIEPIELGSSAESELSVAAVEPSPVVEALEPEAPEASSEPVQPEAPAPSIEPEETMAMVAMPTPRSDRPPDQPRQPPPERRVEPEPEPQPRPSTPPPGNSGNSAADSAASGGGAPPQQSNVGSGGDAEVARYPSQVIGKLRAAMRRGGDSGEVVVRFTLSSGGQLAGVSVARSSGNPAVDAAGTALVQRAAPYPPIPAGAGRDSWTFDVPLAFGGSR